MRAGEGEGRASWQVDPLSAKAPSPVSVPTRSLPWEPKAPAGRVGAGSRPCWSPGRTVAL